MQNLIKITSLLLVLIIVRCNHPSSESAHINSALETNKDSLNLIKQDSIKKVYFDSISKISFEEIIEKCGYEKLDLKERKDSTIRLFIFSGKIGTVAEIFTLKMKNGILKYFYDVCLLKYEENETITFEKSFELINKIVGTTHEIGLLKIISENLNKNEILYKKIENLNLCHLQNEKPKERDVLILHKDTYYLEIASNQKYCIISRDQEQEIEEEFRNFTNEVQSIARKSYIK